MPKQNRKRRLEPTPNDSDTEIEIPKNKFRPYTEETQAEEEHLNKILFGGASSFLKSLEEAENEPAPSCSNVDSGVGEDDSEDSEMKERAPAWNDEEDDGIEVGFALDTQGRRLPPGGINDRKNKYSALLANKFQTVMGTPKWASLDKKTEMDDSDDEILQTCGFLKKGAKKAGLGQGTLEFKKVKDLNSETYSEGPFINSVEFHPTSSVALVAGSNGIATLYAVDGKRNNKLHSVSFENFPILSAKFINNGNEAILGSRHSHIYSYDLMGAKAARIPLPPGLTQFKKFTVSPDSKFMAVAGKWGEVHLLTTASKERIATLKQDSEVTALEYNPGGTLLYGHSEHGEITVWDTAQRRVRHKFTDEGCLQGTSLAVAPSNQFLAAGSAQGVVNLYNMEDVLASRSPKPRKTILNLTTGITDLKFNSSAEILGFASIDVPNAVKMFHVASGSVFSNFPSFQAKLGHVNVVNFSPGSGFVAFGNKNKTVALYRLKHFKNY